MKINKLELINFRCFEKYEIEFSDRFTLLIGDNGSGKTTILDALSFSINNFLKGFPHYHYEGDPKEDDIRFTDVELGQTPLRERTGSMKITTNGFIDNERTLWTTSRYSPPLMVNNDEVRAIRLIASRLSSEITSKDTILPTLAFYRTGRLWSNPASQLDTLSPDSRFAGYEQCLNPASNLERLFRWLKTQELVALQKNETRHVLEAVRFAIVEMIPDAKRIWWDFDWDEILIETYTRGKSRTIPFHLLSDGYRNMIGMVADIAYRMATLNPQLEADVIKQTEGIVLIDEIDLHLHPKWQREVVGRLMDTFPKVQFVASSHSPFIIQSLYHREDVLLWDLEKAAPV